MRQAPHPVDPARADAAGSAARPIGADASLHARPSVDDATAVVTLRRRLRLLALGVTALFATFDVWLLPASTLIVSPENYLGTAKAAAALLVALAGGILVRRRFRHDPSSLGGFVRTMAEREIVFANVALIFATFTVFAVLFMYLASNTTAPLVDDELAAADAAIGFHWVTWLGLANSIEFLPPVLASAYGATGAVLAGLLACLSFTRPEERVLELIALVAVTSFCTGVLMYLFPAAGAYVWFHPSADLFDRFPTGAGVWHYRVLSALRSGEPFTYVQGHAVGLVTFPSFHTMLAIVTTYAARGLRVVFPGLLALNTLMIVSTVPYGGHYLVDVLAGGAIALVAIVGVRAIGGTPAT